ncbi:MAG: type II toxin-antitoxin system Phd/YefM family antitoxin [Deltaproteobacteria bacterium]|nr:type II toxin-antitoxin system Phd/YefM family antitoxin [Deltaproteobacteria bacterium]
MAIMTASEARKNLYRLLDDVAEDGEPVVITGKRHNAVLLSEEEWRGIEETLHLAAIPGMVDSIRKGMATPASEMSEEPGW